ncbi:MAG: hypothetical protein IJH76_04830 [Clostridia bacterium]|nr:hypothetical protein [Clostridia bacterium]
MNKAEELRCFADSLDNDEGKIMVRNFIDSAKNILKEDIEAKKVVGLAIPCNAYQVALEKMSSIYDKKRFFNQIETNYKIIFLNANKQKYEKEYKELGFELPSKPYNENYLPYKVDNFM